MFLYRCDSSAHSQRYEARHISHYRSQRAAQRSRSGNRPLVYRQQTTQQMPISTVLNYRLIMLIKHGAHAPTAKGKGMDTCYSALQSQKWRLTDELMKLPQSTASASIYALDQWCSMQTHHTHTTQSIV